MQINNLFKLKKFILSALFISIMFNVTHSFALNLINHDDYSSSIEYLVEFEEPTNHNDSCDLHHEFHHLYTVDQTNLNFTTLINNTKFIYLNNHIKQLAEELTKPPTA